MKFSVIIPTYNDWPRLMKCLYALENQTLNKDCFEVIVVNNNESEIIPVDVALPFQNQVVHESMPGSYAARNKGVALARGDVLVFTDSDCIPDKDWLVNVEKYFEEPTCDLVGGRIQVFQPQNGNKYGYLYDHLTAFQQHKNVPAGRGVTANLFVKKSVFEAVGGFDSSIKSGGDWDFTLRCMEMGFRMIYGEDVLVLHPARNLKAIFKKHYRLSCGGAVNVKKKYGYSYFRILGSHLLHGMSFRGEYLSQDFSRREKMVILSIDMLKYLYRAFIYGAIMLRLVDPNKARK